MKRNTYTSLAAGSLGGAFVLVPHLGSIRLGIVHGALCALTVMFTLAAARNDR